MAKLILQPKEKQGLEVIEFTGLNINEIKDFIESVNLVPMTPLFRQIELNYDFVAEKNTSIMLTPNGTNKILKKLTIKIGEFICYDGNYFFVRNYNQLSQKYNGL